MESQQYSPIGPDDPLHRLAERFVGAFSRATVDQHAWDCYALLDRTSRIKAHLPALTEHFARERLTARAKTQELIVSDKPTVLFVCVHNAGRSQMAAALLDHHAAGRVQVLSAGLAPADQINPAVVEVMAELGLDMSNEYPKPLTTEAVQASDVVITMGCSDACPIFPSTRYLDWQLADPVGQGVDALRPIRDDIDRRVQGLLAELLPMTA